MSVNVYGGSELEIPESADARDQMFAGMADPVLVHTEPAKSILPQSDGSFVMFRTEQQNGNDYYLFLQEDGEDFPLVGPGAYVIRRRQSDGAFSQVKVFLQHDEGSFARIVPHGELSRMDLFLAGTQIYRGISVPMPFQQVLLQPFSRLQHATASIVDWSVFSIDPDLPEYRRVESVVEEIRAQLPLLPDAEDGAIDALGRFVFIENEQEQSEDPGLNCSGFAKWIVDGYCESDSGELLPIEPLKTKHLDARGTRWSAALEDERDPYFGLDWTRNLSLAMNDGLLATDWLEPEIVEKYDVTDVPFSTYTEDVGYPVKDVAAILYWLARTEPGNVYLGSVSTSFGEEPVLRQHTHVVVFFPYFDAAGRFNPVIFERNVETGIASLENRYGNDYVHLVRLDHPGSFKPPEIPSSDQR